MCLGPKFLKSGCLGVASWVRSGVLVYRSGFWNSSFFVVQSYDYDWISVMTPTCGWPCFLCFIPWTSLIRSFTTTAAWVHVRGHGRWHWYFCTRRQQNNFLYNHWVSVPWTSIFRKFLNAFRLELYNLWRFGMDIWSAKDEAFFLKLLDQIQCVCFFFYRSIFSQQKDAECIINSFSLHKLLGDPLMSFWRRYPVSTQALPWWPPGHNGNNVFSSFGASKKVRLENLPNNFWSWSRQRFFFGQSGRKKRLRLKRRMLRIVEIFFCFGCTTPMKNGRNYLPTYVPQLVGSCSWVVLPMRIVGIILPKLIRTKAQAKLWERRRLILLGRSLVKSLLTFISLGCHPWSRLGRWMNPLNHHFNRNPPIYGEETSEVAW